MGPVTLLIATLVSANLSWGCASTPEPDPKVGPEVPEDLEGLDRGVAPELAIIQREVGALIMSGFRMFEGMTGAVTACLQDQDCTEWNSYAGALAGIAQRAPEDDYVQGQVAYSLVRGNKQDLALSVLEGCQASEWWCRVLQGFALAESGRIDESGAAFDQAFLLMPDADLCEWNDVRPLISRGAWLHYEGSSCLERLERMELFWWLSDPAWSEPGNDRKVEHYNRMAWATLHDAALMNPARTVHLNFSEAHSQTHHIEVIRHGMDIYRWDARWGKLCDWPGRFSCVPCRDDPDRRRRARDSGTVCCERVEWPWPYCSYTPDAQTYRVVPEERALLDPFHASSEDWPLEQNGSPENYVPQAGALVPMDAQVAFFERGDSLVATAASEVPDDPAFRVAAPNSAVLLLGTGPTAPLITADAPALDGRWVFQVTVPRRRYVVGIEAVGREGVARARFGHGLPHDPAAPLRLSDILLYSPPNGSQPTDSLEAVVPLMKGGQRWSQGEVMGVFLEVYGPPEAASFPVTVELEGEAGWVARLGEALGLGGGRPVTLRWAEAGIGGRFALSFTVNLREAAEGNYTLRVSVAAPGISPATVERSLRIVEGGF
jgi:hypothetical protein